MARLGNYLRMHRRARHLTQGELAFLFGYVDQSIIARLERDKRTITLVVARACQVILGVEPQAVFPSLFDSIETGIADRVRELRDRLLRDRPTQKTLAKLAMLQEVLKSIAEQEV
jgi:transcriptional regulator with XRE-family HTH domain